MRIPSSDITGSLRAKASLLALCLLVVKVVLWLAQSQAEACHPGAPGMFVAVGDDETSLTSSGGAIWRSASARPEEPKPAVQGNGMCLKIGSHGDIDASRDGIVWLGMCLAVPDRLHALAYGNGVFVAVGNEGALVTSGDGLVWTKRNSRTDERLRGIAYGRDQFVVVGYAGTILTSRNGRRWTSRDSGTDERLLSVAYGRGRFVAVGWNGILLTSENGRIWTRRESGTRSNLIGVKFMIGDAFSFLLMPTSSPNCLPRGGFAFITMI